MTVVKDIAEALVKGDAGQVRTLVQTALDDGVRPVEIIQAGLIAGMAVVGERFKHNEIYVPEVLVAARAMHAGLDLVNPLLTEGEIETAGVFVIGTVKGDLHDIGKNLVVMMLQGAGFEVIDLGVDVGAEQFVSAAKEHNADFVGLSALLTTTMVNMRDVVLAFEQAGLRDKVKIIIGGAPVTQEFCDQINADGYAPDASSAVDVAKDLIG